MAALDPKKLIGEAFVEGFKRLASADPNLAPYSNFAAQHADMARISAEYAAISSRVRAATPGMRNDQRGELIKNDLATWIYNYRWNAFDTQGKKVLFANTSELQGRLYQGDNMYAGSSRAEKWAKQTGPVSGLFRMVTQHGPIKWINNQRRRNLDGYDEFSRAGHAMKEVYELAAKDPEQQRRTPGLYQAADTYAGLEFARVATDVMAAGNLIRPNEQYRIRKDIDKGKKYQIKKATEEIKTYTASKVAASILGVMGVGVIVATGLNFTGNAINDTIQVTQNSSVTASMAGVAMGIILLAIAGLIFSHRRYKIKVGKKAPEREERSAYY